MAKEDFMSTLYKNCRNLTIEVLDDEYMALRLYFLLDTRIVVDI